MNNKLYKPILIDSIRAQSNIPQHRFIGFDGNICQASEKALGVSDVSIGLGEYVPVGVLGILLVEAADDIEIGAEVTSDEQGRAIAVTESEVVNGYSLDEGREGDLIRIVRGI